jgi:NADPH-dependent glutamate synthase beta subunit-like oxidoreductase
MELGEPDAKGKRHPVPVKGAEFVKEFNTIITAVGRMPDVPEDFQVATAQANLIRVNQDGSVIGLSGVFAGGDAVTGPASVIEAIASGRKCAMSIDRYLGGSGIIDEELAPTEEPKTWLGRHEKFAYQQRNKIPCLPLGERLNNFNEIERGYDEETAIKEAQRCLQCDLRLKISPVKVPPKKGSIGSG